MICYRLRCDSEHDFEGWFRTGLDFDDQASAGLIGCPICGSASVERALMAPAVVGSSKRRREAAGPALEGDVIAPDKRPKVPDGEMPAALRALLTRMRQEIERNCDHVGREFADQAIKMHRGETEKRAIYGETTEIEREVLAEEGVEVALVPWIKRADS